MGILTNYAMFELVGEGKVVTSYKIELFYFKLELYLFVLKITLKPIVYREKQFWQRFTNQEQFLSFRMLMSFSFLFFLPKFSALS